MYWLCVLIFAVLVMCSYANGLDVTPHGLTVVCIWTDYGSPRAEGLFSWAVHEFLRDDYDFHWTLDLVASCVRGG